MKTDIYVLEVFADSAYFEEMLNWINERATMLRRTSAESLAILKDHLQMQITHATKEGGTWKAVLGRPTQHQLIEDGYDTWSYTPGKYRVVQAVVDDAESKWFEYHDAVERPDLTEGCIRRWTEIQKAAKGEH